MGEKTHNISRKIQKKGRIKYNTILVGFLWGETQSFEGFFREKKKDAGRKNIGEKNLAAEERGGSPPSSWRESPPEVYHGDPLEGGDKIFARFTTEEREWG